MIICNKCRCREVCGLRDEYMEHYTGAREAYRPENRIFETTVRCSKYIPDKRKDEGHERNTDRD